MHANFLKLDDVCVSALNLVRNNTIGHQWQKEERDIPNPFIPGVTSDVRFFAGIDRMEVNHYYMLKYGIVRIGRKWNWEMEIV